MPRIMRLYNQVHEAESAIDTMDPNQAKEWEPTGTLEQMRKELKVSIESTVEKSVMETQMNKSKVPESSDYISVALRLHVQRPPS